MINMANLESKLISDSAQLWGTWESNPQSRGIVDRLKSGKPVRLIGPCAAQTKDQVLSILEVTASHSDGVRLPDKKPRTRPVRPDGSVNFTGIGHGEVLSIYRTIGAKYPRLAIGAETMSGADVHLLAAAGILGFAWSGSRTQEQETLRELGSAASETNTLMMIKNPLTPDQEMYLGMMENWILGPIGIENWTINSKGTIPFMACIRGESPTTTEDKAIWRNTPNINLIDVLARSFPSLPIIIDPSHMVKAPIDEMSKAKRLRLVVDLIRTGLDHGAKGYMVEVHHPNHRSLTDPGENVYELMNELDRYNLI